MEQIIHVLGWMGIYGPMALGAIGSLEEGRQIVRRSFEVTGFTPRYQWDWDQAYTRLEHIVEKAR